MKQPLLGLTLTELQTVVKNLGLPGFAAKQIAAWLYDKKVASIDEMTNFTVVRYRGDKEAADNFYKGIRPLTGDDIAETVYFAASAPAHIQIAEVLLMPTYQATGTISYKKKPE